MFILRKKRFRSLFRKFYSPKKPAISLANSNGCSEQSKKGNLSLWLFNLSLLNVYLYGKIQKDPAIASGDFADQSFQQSVCLRVTPLHTKGMCQYFPFLNVFFECLIRFMKKIAGCSRLSVCIKLK